ncbi:phosphotransferase [Deinococcus cellulosilyticus]|nr:phosphotransferase [Deinococcus cellulosilyticus]
MSDQPTLHFFARALILHPTRDLVLLQDGKVPEREHSSSLYMGNLVSSIFASCGPLVYLQRLSLNRQQLAENEWNVHYVFALVAASPEAPEGFFWASPDELPEDLQPLAERALQPSPLVPWQARGWMEQALNWTDQVLGALGRSRTGQPEMIKAWQISVLYRIPTSEGPVYLKQVPAFFAREGLLTSWLHTLNAGAAPEVLALDPEHHRFLMAGAGNDPVGPDKAISAVKLFATVQRQTEHHHEHLLEVGCLDRRCKVLKEQVRELFADDAALGIRNLLSAEEQQTLKTALPGLEQLLDDLHNSPIPTTLIHGDLHLGNVISAGDSLTFLDWSDGALGHPFLDLNSEYLLESEDPAAHQSLIDSYLEHWTDLLPLEELRILHKKAVRAGELHRAVSYHRHIIPGVPDRSEWEDAHIEHLQNLLKLLNT